MKLQSVVRWMVLATIFLVAARAFAQPVNLVCTRVVDKDIVHRITFDESRGIAFFEDDPASRASFTSNNVKWSGFYSQNLPMVAFKLDRISGILVITLSYGLENEYDCVVAPERKF